MSTSPFPHTTADLAGELQCTTTTVRKRAKALGLGIDLQGRAGFRYSDEDRKRLIESFRPAVEPAKKRAPRRRGGRAA